LPEEEHFSGHWHVDVIMSESLFANRFTNWLLDKDLEQNPFLENLPGLMSSLDLMVGLSINGLSICGQLLILCHFSSVKALGDDINLEGLRTQTLALGI